MINIYISVRRRTICYQLYWLWYSLCWICQRQLKQIRSFLLVPSSGANLVHTAHHSMPTVCHWCCCVYMVFLQVKLLLYFLKNIFYPIIFFKIKCRINARLVCYCACVRVCVYVCMRVCVMVCVWGGGVWVCVWLFVHVILSL